MYSALLILHNILRWGVLLGGFWAIIQAMTGLSSRREFTANDNRSQLIFVIFCHTQLLLGIILYFVSPVVQGAMDSGMVMKEASFRFAAIEHPLTMLIAIILVQVGRSTSKKATTAVAKHKKALIFFSIGMLLILSRIPWNKALMPGM